MPTTKIVFEFILEFDQFDSQDVVLGAPFPPISIVLRDSSRGLHEFSIGKQLPHLHPSVLDSAVEEAKLQIEHFSTVLAFVRDTKIIPTGNIYCEVDDKRRQINLSNLHTKAKLTGIAGKSWFTANETRLHKKYNLDLIKRLNFACSVSEPVGRFIALYSLLLTVGKDKQSELDKLIMTVEPSTHQTESPRDGKLETIYTRLRNELAHVRQTATVFSTHKEIHLHLQRFEWIAKEIIRPACE